MNNKKCLKWMYRNMIFVFEMWLYYDLFNECDYRGREYWHDNITDEIWDNIPYEIPIKYMNIVCGFNTHICDVLLNDLNVDITKMDYTILIREYIKSNNMLKI